MQWRDFMPPLADLYMRQEGPTITDSMRPYLQYAGNTGKTAVEGLDKALLAYVSLALESNCSIILCSEDTGTSMAYLRAIANMVPAGEHAVVMEKDLQSAMGADLQFTVMAPYGKPYHVSPEKRIAYALDGNTRWVILDRISGSEAGALFLSADNGASFISTFKGSASGMDLLNVLSAKPFLVRPDNLSALDIAIILPHNVHDRITISEYRWLSRVEIEEGEDINRVDMVKMDSINLGSKCSITGSKTITRYSQLIGCSKNDAIMEFERRVKKTESAGN